MKNWNSSTNAGKNWQNKTKSIGECKVLSSPVLFYRKIKMRYVLFTRSFTDSYQALHVLP